MPPHEELLEVGKFLLDLFKQLIALDTAMLAAIITIVEKVFTTQRVRQSFSGKVFLGGSVLFFVLSLFFSVAALLQITNNLAMMLQGVVMDKWVGDFYFYGSIIFFSLGIALFLCLAAWSFLSRSASENHAKPKAKTLAKAK